MRDYHRTSSVTNMLCQLNWPTLEHRRKVSKLVMLYKIHHRTVDVPSSHLIPMNTCTEICHPNCIHPGIPARILSQHHQNVECLTSSVGHCSLLRGIQAFPTLTSKQLWSFYRTVQHFLNFLHLCVFCTALAPSMRQYSTTWGMHCT